MAAPVIFISTYAIRAGTLHGLRQFLQELFGVLEQNEPRALAINAYVNGEGTEVAIVQVHPDGASIKEYWKAVHEHTGRELAQFLDAPTSTQVYGDTSDLVLARTRHSAQSGVVMSVKPEHVGGFTRLAPAAGPPGV
jgi:hypothetical protein